MRNVLEPRYIFIHTRIMCMKSINDWILFRNQVFFENMKFLEGFEEKEKKARKGVCVYGKRTYIKMF